MKKEEASSILARRVNIGMNMKIGSESLGRQGDKHMIMLHNLLLSDKV